MTERMLHERTDEYRYDIEVTPDQLLDQTVEILDSLKSYSVLDQLNPERYDSYDVEALLIDDTDNAQGVPIEFDIVKILPRSVSDGSDAELRRRASSSTKKIQIKLGQTSFTEYARAYGRDSQQSDTDLLKLFVGYAVMHDLAIRALSPDKADEFIDHITKPNGLYSDLLGAHVIDDDENEAAIREYLIGDEDRIAKVNVARFAIGAVCEAVAGQDKGFRQRVVGAFRPGFMLFLSNGESYRHTARTVFRQSHEEANMMFVEHIKDFDLAAAFPKSGREVEDFVDIYGVV